MSAEVSTVQSTIELPYINVDVRSTMLIAQDIGNLKGRHRKKFLGNEIEGGYSTTRRISLFGIKDIPYDYMKIYVPRDSNEQVKLMPDFGPTNAIVELWTPQLYRDDIQTWFGFIEDSENPDNISVVQLKDGKSQPASKEDFLLLQKVLNHVQEKFRKSKRIHYGHSPIDPEQLRG